MFYPTGNYQRNSQVTVPISAVRQLGKFFIPLLNHQGMLYFIHVSHIHLSRITAF